jgi:integrase
MGRARRDYGSGSVHQTADGRWVAWLELGFVGGKRKRKKLSARTQAEVKRKLSAAQRQQLLGEPLTAERQTVAQFLARWLADVVRPNAAPSTYAQQEMLVRRHIIPHLGDRLLTKLAAPEIQAFYAAKLREEYAPGKCYSPGYLRQIHAVLHHALATAEEWELVPRNVSRHTKRPRVPKRKHQVLTQVQARHLLAVVRDDPREALWVLALHLGLREGELLGLRWSDVDWKHRQLHVRNKILRVQRAWEEGLPKGRRERTIDLEEHVLAVLRRHEERQAVRRQQAGEWGRPDLVFPTDRGEPLRADVLRNWHFRQLLKRADLPRMTVHELRHSMATLALEDGVPVELVQEILGHSSPAITLGMYRHILPHEPRRAVERIARLLAVDEDATSSPGEMAT